jgi:hypothetical protein
MNAAKTQSARQQVRFRRHQDIIEALADDPDASFNEHVLWALLNATGCAISLDRLRTDLQRLAEQGLVSKKSVSGVLTVRLTPRGKDAASMASHAGGQQPGGEAHEPGRRSRYHAGERRNRPGGV